MDISKETIQAVYRVWDIIGGDCEEACKQNDGVWNNEIAVECCLDANHISFYLGEKGQVAEAEIRELIQQHTYDEVLKEFSKAVFLV